MKNFVIGLVVVFFWGEGKLGLGETRRRPISCNKSIKMNN